MKEIQKSILGNIEQKIGEIPPPSSDGEIDFQFLSILNESREGWLGYVTQKLSAAFAEDVQNGNPVGALEDAAAAIVAWASDIQSRSNQKNRPKKGAELMIRVPNHRSRFLAVMGDNGEVWVEFLNRSYSIDEVQILPSQQPIPKREPTSPTLQKTLQSTMQTLEQRIQQ